MKGGQVWWLVPVILDTLEVELRRVADQSRQKVHEIPSHPIEAGYGDMCLTSQLFESINKRSKPAWA
jgi:hypothetical protein